MEKQMNYILITDSGEKISFYIRECAEIFKYAFGGHIVDISQPNTDNIDVLNDTNNKNQLR